MSEIFRKKALERLASPEQLDSLLKITSPRGWAGLLACGICLVTVLMWGIYGTIPFKVAGEGLLMNKDGLFTIMAESSGLLIDLTVKEGDEVIEGQIIAHLTKPELRSHLEVLTRDYKDLQAQYKYRKSKVEEEELQNRTDLKSRKATLEFNINSYNKRITRLQRRVDNQKELVAEGLIAKSELNATMNTLDDARATLLSNKEELKKVEGEVAGLASTRDLQLLELAQKLDEAQGQLKSAQTVIASTSEIKAPYTGKVVGLAIKNGSLIEPGTEIATIQVQAEKEDSLKMISFFSASSGGKIKIGMNMQISPSSVDADRYGYVLGRVSYISEFPATSAEIKKVLQNDELVQEMDRMGPVIEVHATLLSDAATPSGFKWTSAEGPPLKLRPGRSSSGSVIVDTRSPLSLVLPLMRKYVLGSGEVAK